MKGTQMRPDKAKNPLHWAWCTLIVLIALSSHTIEAQTGPKHITFDGEFSHAAGLILPGEKPWRDEICLNGLWRFQPVEVPSSYARNEGVAPDLTLPTEGAWETTPLKVPSPWNVNVWGNGRNVGAGTEHPFWPDSVYFPSYPRSWEHTEMGWLQRNFNVPETWKRQRIILHFEAVAGDCKVFVNRKPAGQHFDAYLPFDLDITSMVRTEANNELLVGVRSRKLFDKQSKRYPKMHAPYPTGSNTGEMVGIWQDVFLQSVPPLRATDVFVKPEVDKGILELEVTFQNDSDIQQQFQIGGDVRPWINDNNLEKSGDSRCELGLSTIKLTSTSAVVAPHATGTAVIRTPIASGALKTWAPGSPNLYVAVLSLQQSGKIVDQKMTRFGWRQFIIQGKDVLLNGEKIQLFGDLLHPFGPYILSRDYAWAWYKLVKGFGGNSVRLHAQIHPRHFLDLADEMGIVVLDETAIFGSSVALNFEEPVAWQRFAEHYDGLIRRDRNSPSVLGWSVGNELFAIFDLNNVSKQDSDRWHAQLSELALRAYRVDSTRPWVSCDGDEDLKGTLPIYSKHFGLGLAADRLPAEMNKPMMVGESGGSYYARPDQLAVFNRSKAYENYAGRNDALGIDIYDNIVHMAKPKLAYFSASETAWFGVEHLSLGYRDFSRLPSLDDGIFLTAPFQEGKPGIQPERLPPYTTTLNPGWDVALPMYKPLGMFNAEKAALAVNGPLPCDWDHKSHEDPHQDIAPELSIRHVAFIGDRHRLLFHRLEELGVSMLGDGEDQASAFTIVDVDNQNDQSKLLAQKAFDHVKEAGATLLFVTGDKSTPGDTLEGFGPDECHLTDRNATSLVSDLDNQWTRSFNPAGLCFLEDHDHPVMLHGLAGSFVDHGRVLLKASEEDWSLLDSPESAKCGALVLHEKLIKPSGVVLAQQTVGNGKVAICSLDYSIASRPRNALWRSLLSNMGVALGNEGSGAEQAFEGDVLVSAIVSECFAAESLKSAVSQNFEGQSAMSPKKDQNGWRVMHAAGKDRFNFVDLKASDAKGPSAVYFSYWIKSPRATDDVFTAGPDAPRFAQVVYSADDLQLLVNGVLVQPTRAETADYRTMCVFDPIPLKKGWNHFLIKVAALEPDGEKQGTCAVRISSNKPEFFQQLESALELPQGEQP